MGGGGGLEWWYVICVGGMGFVSRRCCLSQHRNGVARRGGYSVSVF